MSALRTVIPLFCVFTATALLIFRVWRTRSRKRHARALAMWSAVLFFAMAQLTSVPENAFWLREFSGVPNIARLLTYSFACAVAASFLALALVWRFPGRTAWRKVRWVLIIYGVVICTLAVLFALSSVPEERTHDFPTYYAGSQPTVTALMIVFVATALTSFATLSYWCFTWAGSPDFADLPWLRRGLRLYGSVATTFALWLALVMILTIGSSWFNTKALSPIYDVAANSLPIVAVVLWVAALMVPVWGPRWPAMRSWVMQWRSFSVLRSLHRVLRTVAPANVLVTRKKRLDPHHRVRRMVIELNDWRTTLRPLFNTDVHRAAEEQGQRGGLTGEELEALVEAAQLYVAIQDWSRGIRPAGAVNPHDEESIRDGSGSIDAEIAWWTRVAHAYKRHTPLPDREPANRTVRD